MQGLGLAQRSLLPCDSTLAGLLAPLLLALAKHRPALAAAETPYLPTYGIFHVF